MADGAPEIVDPGHNALTRLAAVMLQPAYESGIPGVRAVVMLDAAEDGTVALAGYDPGDVPAAVLADIADHLAALGRQYGVRMALVIGESGGRKGRRWRRHGK